MARLCVGCPLFLGGCRRCLSLAVRCATRGACLTRSRLFRRRVRACQSQCQALRWGFACIPVRNQRRFFHAVSSRGKGALEVGSIEAKPKRRLRHPPPPKPRAARGRLCLIRRAPLAICGESALQTIYIDSQSVCALFVASAARHNQKTKHPAKSIPSKTPRAVASCTEPQRRNSRAAAHNSPPRWPTPTSPHNRRFRPRRRKRRPRPRRPP